MFEQDTWRFINSFAPWLSAFGTLTAVVVSLYLAARDRRIQLEVRFTVVVSIPGQGDRLASVQITNRGRRTAHIPIVGFSVGILKRREFMDPRMDGPNMPAKLEDGDSVMFTRPLHSWVGDLVGSLERKHVFPLPRLRARSLRAIVATTAGKTFVAPAQWQLRNEFVSQARKPFERS